MIIALLIFLSLFILGAIKYSNNMRSPFFEKPDKKEIRMRKLNIALYMMRISIALLFSLYLYYTYYKITI